MQTENLSPDSASDIVLNQNSTYLAQQEALSHIEDGTAQKSEEQPEVLEDTETPEVVDTEHDYSEDIEQIKNQEAELKKEYPSLDLSEEIENDPFIAQMLARGYDVRSIFELKYPGIAENRLMKSQRDSVLENIRTRNARPRSIGSGGYFNSVRDVKNMSEEEIMRIDAKIKRGQRVTL